MLSHFLRKLGSLFARRDPHAVRAGGFVWHPASPSVRPHLPTLFAHPSAALVKENHQRTIVRVELPGGAVFVKRSRANTPRAWVRELLRPPKARLEFDNAVRLRELGLPCAEPLAWGAADSAWPGESVIVTREAAGAVPLDAYLGEDLSPADRRGVAVAIGRLFAAMHAAGVAHPDPHPGNFLIHVDDGGWRFVLLDVHAVRFGPPLTWDERRANLVLFNRWFQLRASFTDRARFWRAYAGETAGERVQQIEADTAASNRRFWAARDARYLGTNRQFRRVKAGTVRGHAVRELSDELVRGWLTDPDAVFTMPGAVLLKDSPSSTVAVIPLSFGGEGLGVRGGLLPAT
jgi:tRNA A-37 threonylcarbamoyl transferase component Bud32